MITSFMHKGLEEFFVSGSKAGITATHESKLRRLLAKLNVSVSPQDMNVPGWGFHGLHGKLAGHYAVSVNGNWRLTFKFEGNDAILVDYQDYH
ncbi:type II toxin-antitoxin system RelE/ParE family toxin [Robbsia sp. Bb-Pol-6]|uniref:Type II toxin-antitoxin system RelE/ParE family toxin n=1 Tax=Robbsia betulipollinis TaxID=2981849 RepID=A0ABT3ZRD2_9BURK|nr:type II toxin-antitoxin system RelE/ParE family toxin [Robbsia betulipollinis]MCY0389121.1 type II toxin-antitoxin system RelE/ParE family toxin [Robbsia betulipollinis]